MSGEPTGPAGALAGLRGAPRRRYAAMAAGAVLGILLATLHWVGLVVGGALVGLAATDLKRALVGGLAFGVLAWVAFAVQLALGGALDGALSTGRILYVSVGIALGCGLLGSLARGIV